MLRVSCWPKSIRAYRPFDKSVVILSADLEMSLHVVRRQLYRLKKIKIIRYKNGAISGSLI